MRTTTFTIALALAATLTAQEGAPPTLPTAPVVAPTTTPAAQDATPAKPELPASLTMLISMARSQDVIMQAELSTTKEWKDYQKGETDRAEIQKRIAAERSEQVKRLQEKANTLASQRASIALKQRAEAEVKALGYVSIDWATGQPVSKK